jgi:CRP-like cAMP-binding protein
MSLDEDLRNLSRIPFFATLETDARRLLAFAGEARILRGGDVLYRKGDASDGGFVVQSGAIVLTSGDTPTASDAQIIRPHTLIGEIALISQTERTTNAFAREPSTVLKISRPLFHRVLKEHPISAARLKAFIEKRLTDFTSELVASPLADLAEISERNRR